MRCYRSDQHGYTVEATTVRGEARWRIRLPDTKEGIPSTGVLGDPSAGGEKFYRSWEKAQRVADRLNRRLGP